MFAHGHGVRKNLHRAHGHKKWAGDWPMGSAANDHVCVVAPLGHQLAVVVIIFIPDDSSHYISPMNNEIMETDGGSGLQPGWASRRDPARLQGART